MKSGDAVTNYTILLIKIINFTKTKVLGCMDRLGDKDRYDKLISKENVLKVLNNWIICKFYKVKCGQNKTGAIQTRTCTKIRASEVGSSAIEEWASSSDRSHSPCAAW